MQWRPDPRRLGARSGRSAAIYAGRALLRLSIAFGALGAQPLGYAHAAGDVQPFDLSIDQDKDGIPDQLALAVKTIGEAKTEEEQDAAIKDFASRLPYSDETRAAQDKTDQLQQQLAATEDPKQAEQLTEQIQALGKEMKQDPGYAQTIEALDTMFKPDELKDEMQKQSIPWSRAQRGDILLQLDLLSFTSYLYAMNYNHTGNFYGQSGGEIFESVVSGVRLSPLSDWQGGVKYVMIARDSVASQQAVINAMENRKHQFIDQRHTPYNFNLMDKWTDNAVYCAQLTWKIHKDVGVDLDSQSWIYKVYITARWGWMGLILSYPAVAPDEIRLSPNIFPVGSGWSF
jgi:Permuted papain-like amidase enzyme, YaeF/YiiX, C92 family